MIRPELLAPAGDMEKLKTAFYFGADAAYAGGKDLSLRAGAGGFTDGEFKEAVRFSHALGKKLYAAVNIFCKNALRILLKDIQNNFCPFFVDIDALVFYPIAVSNTSAGKQSFCSVLV